MKLDRHHQMALYFLNNKKATIQELCEVFHISVETARRDLNELERDGTIKRVYGGAVLQRNVDMHRSLGPWNSRLGQFHPEKLAIAKEALKYVPDNATIALDTATTVFEMAKLLSEKKNLTIITNCMHHAIEINSNTDHIVYFVGGAMKKDELITTGFFATDFLNHFSKIDLAIVSADGFNLDSGISDYTVEMGVIKKIMMEKSEKIYYLGDHSKFAIDAFFVSLPPEKVDMIITDPGISKADVAKIRKLGIDLKIASV